MWHDSVGRYGEALGWKPAGIEARYFGRDGLVRRWMWERVESVRHLWRVVKSAIGERARRVAELVESIRAMGRSESRTRVNNCTGADAPELWTTGPVRAKPPQHAGPAPADGWSVPAQG